MTKMQAGAVFARPSFAASEGLNASMASPRTQKFFGSFFQKRTA
jgi:hypothetical protein